MLHSEPLRSRIGQRLKWNLSMVMDPFQLLYFKPHELKMLVSLWEDTMSRKHAAESAGGANGGVNGNELAVSSSSRMSLRNKLKVKISPYSGYE